MDKHAIKVAGKMDGTRIFSFADRSNLIDLASEFSNFMQQQHNDIRQVRNIQPDHVQHFLETKRASVSQATLSQYASRFNKLERLVNDTYKSCQVDFHSIVVPPSTKNGGGKVRNQMLSAGDFQTVYSSATNTNLRAGLVLSYGCGLRASEICKLKRSDFDLANNTIHIVDAKGKRNRTVKIPQQFQQQIQNIVQNAGNRICPLQTESLQKAFRRQLKSCGLGETYPNGAFHLCRKAYATNLYLECRSNSMSVPQALATVSGALGHGASRNSLMKEYICTPLT